MTFVMQNMDHFPHTGWWWSIYRQLLSGNMHAVMLWQPAAYQATTDQAVSNHQPNATKMAQLDCSKPTGYNGTTFSHMYYIHA